jgi:hypothetical protein
MVFNLFKPSPIPWSKWFSGVFVLAGMFGLMVFWHAEDTRLHRYATPVSTPFDQGPYRLPDGCLPRAWSVDEYLPADCVRGYVFSGPTASLQRTRHGRRRSSSFLKPRQLQWVRVNADAVLIARTIPNTGGMIVQVEHGRFRPTRLPVMNIAADPPPLGYWFFYGMAFVIHGGLLALMGMSLWSRRPWQRPPEAPAVELVAA